MDVEKGGTDTGGGRWCQKQCADDLPRGYGTHDDDDELTMSYHALL
jgi:hypothetical protein